MSVAIFITGTHGCGKTTLVRTFEGRPGFRVILADLDRRFKTTPARVTRAYLGEWGAPEPVLLVEGTNWSVIPFYTAARFALTARAVRAVVISQTPEVMEPRLRARCVQAGRVFNASYWTRDRYLYEGQRRYPALLGRIAPPGEWREIVMDAEFRAAEQVRAWIEEWATL